MNKIYNTFSRIKASDELKTKTYQKIIEHSYNNKKIKRKYFYPSLAVTSIIICLFLYNYKDITNNFKPEDYKITSIDSSNYETNYIIYNNDKYVLDNSIVIEKEMLDKELEIIHQDYVIGTYISPSNYISIYSIKNISKEEQIAILKDDKVIVYKIEDKTNR